MEEKLKFPMTFTKCPACGSEKRIIETAMSEIQVLKNNQKTALHVFGTALTDPISALTRVTVPVLMVYIDACADCGTIYGTRVEKVLGTPQVGRQPPNLPFGGKG